LVKTSFGVIFKFIESIFSVWNNKDYTTVLFDYLTKVFDSVSHKILISYFEYYAVKCPILNWLKSY